MSRRRRQGDDVARVRVVGTPQQAAAVAEAIGRAGLAVQVTGACPARRTPGLTLTYLIVAPP